jgi:sodium transport system permease protein
MAIVFPLVLYPLLIIGLIQATVVEESRAQKVKPLVAIAGGEYAKDLVARFKADDHIRVTTFDGEHLSDKAVGVAIPEDFDKDVRQGATAKMKIIYDSANDASANAVSRIGTIIDSYSADVLDKRLEGEGLTQEFVSPVKYDEVDVATPRQRGVFKLGKILAFLLVTFCMMGALYPALDTVAGEKERGTLETLLSIPATRLEILGGKYVAVFGMSVASVAANFISLTVTMALVNNLMKSAVSGELPIDFRVPTEAILYIVPALLPLAAFFSAVSLGVATFARSTREGQYYLAPLYAAALPLTSVALVSSINLNYLTAIVPVTGMSLFLKDGLLGTLSLGPTICAIGFTCLYAALALMWAAKVFSREEVLFGAPLAEGEASIEARGTPKPSHAVLVWVVTLILFFYFAPTVGKKLGVLSVPTTLIVYLGFILAPAVIFAAMQRLDFRKLFPLAALDKRRMASILLLVPAALALSIVANVAQRLVLSAPPDLAKAVARENISVLTLFVTIGLIGPVVEELFYRGFIFKTLAARMSPVWAVLISSGLFALAHLNAYETLQLFVLGLVLATTMRATGSLAAPILVHIVNNTLVVYLMVYHPTAGASWSTAANVAAFAGLLVAGVALTWAGWRVARGAGNRD